MQTLIVYGCQNCPFCHHDSIRKAFYCEHPDINDLFICVIQEGVAPINIKPPFICPLRKEGIEIKLAEEIKGE